MATTILPVTGRIKDLADVAAALGLPVDATLRMPDIDLR
jgi:hypothetical protein